MTLPDSVHRHTLIQAVKHVLSMNERRRLGTLLLAGLVTACGQAQPQSYPSVPVVRVQVRSLSVGPADYSGSAWLDTGQIVTAWRPPGQAVSEVRRLVVLEPERNAHREIPRDLDVTRCWRTEDSAPVAVSNGRVAFLRVCQPRGQADESVLQYDVATQDLVDSQLTTLASLGDVRVAAQKLNVYSMSLDPTLKVGVLWAGSRICDLVAQFDDQGLHPWDVRVAKSPQDANLKDAFFSTCPETINARDPVISPSGSHVAVFVAAEAAGKSGTDRLDVPWDLLLIDPKDGSSEVIATGLRDPHSLAWSPDSVWIAFGSLDAAGTPQTFASRPEHVGDLVRFGPTSRITALSWSPDGSQLFGLSETADPLMDSHVSPQLIDMTDVLRAVQR